MNPRLKSTLLTTANRVAVGFVAWAALVEGSEPAANFLKFYTFAVMPVCVAFLLVVWALCIITDGVAGLHKIKAQQQKSRELVPEWFGRLFNLAMIVGLAAAGWIGSAVVWFLYAGFSFIVTQLAKDDPKKATTPAPAPEAAQPCGSP